MVEVSNTQIAFTTKQKHKRNRPNWTIKPSWGEKGKKQNETKSAFQINGKCHMAEMSGSKL